MIRWTFFFDEGSVQNDVIEEEENLRISQILEQKELPGWIFDEGSIQNDVIKEEENLRPSQILKKKELPGWISVAGKDTDILINLARVKMIAKQLLDEKIVNLKNDAAEVDSSSQIPETK